MASLQRLPGDRWRVRVFIDGKLHSRSFSATSERAARQQMAAVEMAIRADVFAETHPDGVTVAELVDDWNKVNASRGLSPTTMRAYRLHTDRLLERFGDMPAAKLTGRDIDAWYADMLAAGRSPATIQHTHRVVRAVLNFGNRSRDLPTVATRRAHPPAHQAPEVNPPSPEVVRRLLEYATGEWGRAVRLLAVTGMRRGEVVGLRWTESPNEIIVSSAVVVVAGEGARIKSPKGRRSRRVAIGPTAAAILAEQRAVVVERCERIGIDVVPWVFPAWLSDPTTPRRPDWVSLMWGRHRERFNAKDVRLHDLRHWYATTALDAGVPLASVSAQLGHAQTSTTANIYGHATDTGRDAAAAAVEGVLGGSL